MFVGFRFTLVEFLKVHKVCVSVLAFALLFSLSYYKIKKNRTLKSVATSIDRVYVLNMERSTDRRKAYEDYVNNNLGGKLFGQTLDKVRFKCTDAKFSIIIENKTTGEKTTSTEFLKGNKTFKYDNLYYIYDIQEPDFIIKYKPASDMGAFITMGELGATMSHLRAIRDVARNDYRNAVILEDDFVFFEPQKFAKIEESDMFKNVPYYYDWIKLDVSTGKKQKQYKISNLWQDFVDLFKNGKNKYFNEIYDHNYYIATGYLISHKGAKKMMNYVENHIFDSVFTIDDEFLFSKRLGEEGVRIFYSKVPIISQRGIVKGNNNESEVDLIAKEFGSKEDRYKRHKKTKTENSAESKN